MSLAKKIAEVIAAVRHPKQSGRNKFHNYDYSTRDDIFAAVRGELSTRGIFILPSVTEIRLDPTGRKSKSGAETIRFDVEVRILLTDGDEEYVSTWWGEAHTEDDKGIQQAVTQALRFFLTNTFMLLDGSDEQMYGEAGTQNTASTNVERAKPAPTTASAKKALANRLATAGVNPDEMKAFAAYIAGVEGVGTVDEVPAGKLQAWVDRMNARDDEFVATTVRKVIETTEGKEAA